MAELDLIENKVAASGLITLNLEDYFHSGERIHFDIKDFLFMEMLLKEKEFRSSLEKVPAMIARLISCNVISSPLFNCLRFYYIPELIYCQVLKSTIQAQTTDQHRNNVDHNLCCIANTVSPSEKQYSSKSKCYNVIWVHVTYCVERVTQHNKKHTCPLKYIVCFIHK